MPARSTSDALEGEGNSEADGSLPGIEDGDGVGEKEYEGDKEDEKPEKDEVEVSTVERDPTAAGYYHLLSMVHSRDPAQGLSSATAGTSGLVILYGTKT